MDRRELADIGLNLSDVRDASALPLDRDPTELLAERGRDRRRQLRRSEGFPRRRRSTPRPASQVARTRLDCIARDDRRLSGAPGRSYRKRRFSRESWLILAQPMSRKSRSISARRKRSARSTPVSPAAASGKRS